MLIYQGKRRRVVFPHRFFISTAHRLHSTGIVKGNLCLPNKSQIEHEILAYLSEHPSAQDTLDGIVQWWLLERKIKYQMAQVQEALNDLVRSGLVLENKSKNSYQMNLNRLKEAKLLLQRSKTGDGHNERNSEMK